MRLPATHFAGNLMWTRQGTVYATWALTALPSGKSDDDLQLVADSHSAFYRSLAGRQALLRGTLVWTDPVAVVARASRDDELVLRGTLADIAGQVAEAGVRRTAVVIVGRALTAGQFPDSHLYSTTRSRA